MRDNKIPTSRPEVTLPTDRPRSAAGTIPAAKGTASCGTTVASPSAKLAAQRKARLVAAATASSAAAEQSAARTMSLRRSVVSPRGTTNNIPAAYPAWVSVATSPAPRSVVEKSAARTARRGWQ